MTEYSRIATGSFTSTGGAQYVNLPFQPTRVDFFNYTAAATPTSNGVPFAYWDALMGQGTAVIQVFNATPVLSTDVVTSNGISTFSAGLSLQYGASQQVAAITKANPGSVTVTAHGYSTGDIVVFEGLFQTATTGMAQINTIPFQITVVDANTFTIPWNTNQSNYTALSASPTGATVKKVLYPFLYAPGVSIINGITTGSTTTITTTTPHNLVVGDEVTFRIPTAYGTTQLNSIPTPAGGIPGSPVYGFVTSVTNSTTVVVNLNSTGYTAFATNQTIASMVGQSFPQMVAVGDVNTGGLAYSGGNFYPSPLVNGVSTINGPAINGAFVNNTSAGFIIGAGKGASFTSAVLVGASTNVIYWRATLSDYGT